MNKRINSMVTPNEALLNYIKIIKDIHQLNLLYIGDIILLPSQECKSYSLINEHDDIVINILLMNGYIKNRFVKFYSEYALKLDLVAEKYCQEYKLDISTYQNDINEIHFFSEHLLSTIEANRKPSTLLASNIEIVEQINLMYEAINHLVNLEYKVKSIINFESLDIVGDSFFKIFKSNELYMLTKLLLNDFPNSKTISAKKWRYQYMIDKVELNIDEHK